MMKNIFLIIMLLVFAFSFGQTNIKKSSISTAGGSAVSGTKTLLFAVGEVNVSEYNVNNLHLSEGFINPDIWQTNGLQNYGELHGVSYYPNPVKDYCYVNTEIENTCEIKVFDINGKLLSDLSFNQNVAVDMSNYKPATYLLLIIDRKNQKVFSAYVIKE